VKSGTTHILIVNASDRQHTLSRNTKLGSISHNSTSTICLTLDRRRNVFRSWSPPHHERNGHRSCGVVRDISCTPLNNQHNHQCYVCNQKFLSGNDLYIHLRQSCYPEDMRDQIEQLTDHIENPMEKQQIQAILWKYGKLFDGRQPSVIKTTYQHAIDTGNHRPVYTPPYRQSQKDQEILIQETNKLLKQGRIEPSISPWSSTVVLIKKKDGSIRFCVDYRKLNTITTKDSYPLPRIDDILDQLSDSLYFTKFDFKSGYFQVPLDKKDRPKTAFSTRDNHFQFTVLPQGPTRWRHCLAYIDDIIIYSKTFKEHLLYVQEVCQLLEQANFRLNVDKCEIAKPEIVFLGHRIQDGNLMPNPDNIRGLLDTKSPTTAKEAFRFVKAAEYYRKFIPHFSQIAGPLYKYAPTTAQQRDKRSQSSKIVLSLEEEAAFNELKRILTTDLVLRLPNNVLPFKLQTDASDEGIGAVLIQTSSLGDHPVAYLSKKFSPTQKKWSTLFILLKSSKNIKNLDI
ncbi:unnamed protein product, partial [Didymodactylos carnosus]